MEVCYPAILLIILGLFVGIKALNSGLYWKAGPVFASPALIFAFISYFLCKKGYKKLAWFMPMWALFFTFILLAGA